MKKVIAFVVLLYCAIGAMAQVHVLVGTYINQGLAGGIGGPRSIPANTFVPIDKAITVTCPGTTGNCLVVSEQWTEMFNASRTPGSSITCLSVDGLRDAFCGHEELFLVGFPATASTSHQTTVSPGTHRVQTFVSATVNAKANYFDYHYLVYKP